jgi:hypothetical protein
MWDFLGKRSEAKRRVELEQERNKGTLEAIQSLKPGMVLIEGGPDWFREIRASEAVPPGTPLNALTSRPPVPTLPVPRNELETAPRNELETALRQAQDPADGPC